MKKLLENFVVRNRVSIYLIFFSWGWTATMIHPNFISIFVVLGNLAILFLLRAVAHAEGRAAK